MNNEITKQIACQLFAWGYKLVDYRGLKYQIKSVDSIGLYLDESGVVKYVLFKNIGHSYFILARSTDKLCEEIEGKVPLVECLKIIFPNSYAYPTKKRGINNGAENIIGYSLCIKGNMIVLNNSKKELTYYNHLPILDHLYSLHFAINLPEGTWKEI